MRRMASRADRLVGSGKRAFRAPSRHMLRIEPCGCAAEAFKY